MTDSSETRPFPSSTRSGRFLGSTLFTPSPKGARAEQPASNLIGRTIDDFRIERLLGRGGMGEVYLATQRSLKRPVALKMIRPERLADRRITERFRAESLAIARLQHPNIVTLHTICQIDGAFCLVMEYVDGTDLRSYLDHQGPPELGMAFSVMSQALKGIQVAGQEGILHRDLKPENLLLTRTGLVKVADFGLCTDLDPSAPRLTQSGVSFGTPMYMSPEQVEGRPLDTRSDLYSLGVTFYHLLSGSPPFVAESPLAVALQHVRETPVPIGDFRSDLPERLELWVARLMAKSPEDRFASAAEAHAQLQLIRKSLHDPLLEDDEAWSQSAIQPVLDAKSETRSQELPDRIDSTQTFLPKQNSSLIKRSTGPKRFGAGVRSKLTGVLVVGLMLGVMTALWISPARLSRGEAWWIEERPGLWLSTSDSVPRQSSAEAQYRRAQRQVSSQDQLNGWVAVIAYFPGQREWTDRAYAQMTRTLYQTGQRDRLTSLGQQMRREQRDSQFIRARLQVIEAAALALDQDESLGSALEFLVESSASGQLEATWSQVGLEILADLERRSDLKLVGDRIKEIRTNLRSRL